MMTRPRPIYRIHRRGRDAYAGRESLRAVDAWLAANRSRLKAGQLAEVVIEHESYCRYPKGGRCTCPGGPEIRIKNEDPRRN
jgi:hypothetical protein